MIDTGPSHVRVILRTGLSPYNPFFHAQKLPRMYAAFIQIICKKLRGGGSFERSSPARRVVRFANPSRLG